MAQYLKDEIQACIVEAGLSVFASKGYRSATMAEIAREAGVSTGNVYRYFPSKDELFYSLIPESLVGRFQRLMSRRIRSLAGVADLSELAADAPFHLISEELMAFVIGNRKHVVILLGKAHGTRYESFAEGLIQDLIRMAVDHFRSLSPALKVTETMQFSLERIYRSFVETMVGILEAFDSEAMIRQAVADFSRYHLAGLQRFFA